MIGATVAAAQTTRAKHRQITVVDDLASNSANLLPATAPPAVYVPPGLDDVYPPPVPSGWGFSQVRCLRFSGAATKTFLRTITPTDFTQHNILVPLRTTDPRSTAGSWQSSWRVAFSSDGGVNTLAELVVQNGAVDVPMNKPGHWQPFEVFPGVISSGSYASSGRMGVPAGKTEPNWSAINWWRVQATSKGSNGHGDHADWDIYLGGLARIARPTEPVLSFYFDWLSRANYLYAVPVFERSLPEYGGDGHYRGWKVTWRGDPTDVDNGGSNLSSAQVTEMQHRKGHRFGIYGGYTGGRKDWTDPDTGVVTQNVFAAGENNMGADPAHTYPVPWDLLAYPSMNAMIWGPLGSADDITGGVMGAKRRLVELGVASHRDMLAGQARKFYGDAYRIITEGMFAYSDIPNGSDFPTWWPPIDPHRVATKMHLAIPDERPDGSTPDQSALAAWLDRVVTEKRWGRFLLHVVTPDTTVGAGFVMTPTQLESFCQMIETRGIKVRSHDDVMAGRV